MDLHSRKFKTPSGVSFRSPWVSAPLSREKASDELKALTGLRFLAASLVVVHHFLLPALRSGPKTLASVVSHGYTSVGLFFLLSGFVLSYRYLDSAGRFRGSWLRFWTARLARIYPAYLLGFLLAAPFVISASLRVNPLRTAILKLGFNGLLSLGLLQAWTPWTAWYWNAPAWSLSAEAFFYLAFPVLAPLVGRMRQRTLLQAVPIVWLVPMAVPLVCAFTRYGAESIPPFRLLQVLLDPGPLFRLPAFFVGMLLGRYFMLENKAKAKFGPAMATFGSLGWIAVLAVGDSIPSRFFFADLLTPIACILILGLARGRGWLATALSMPLMVLLGEASYSLYILQWPIANMFGMQFGTRSVAQFLFFAVTLNFIALLSFKFLETPARKAILRRFGKDRQMTSARDAAPELKAVSSGRSEREPTAAGESSLTPHRVCAEENVSAIPTS
jgi:peptidoglycan/LPS O-acetylase OafA/YrhL